MLHFYDSFHVKQVKLYKFGIVGYIVSSGSIILKMVCCRNEINATYIIKNIDITSTYQKGGIDNIWKNKRNDTHLVSLDTSYHHVQ